MKNDKHLKNIFTRNIIFFLIIPLLVVMIITISLMGINSRYSVRINYTHFFSMLTAQIEFQLESIEQKVLAYKPEWVDSFPATGDCRDFIQALLRSDYSLLKVQVEKYDGLSQVFFPPGRERDYVKIPDFFSNRDAHPQWESLWCGGGYIRELERYIVKIALAVDPFIVSFYYDVSSLLLFIGSSHMDSFIVLDEAGTILSPLPAAWESVITPEIIRGAQKSVSAAEGARKINLQGEKYWIYSDILNPPGWVLFFLQHESEKKTYLSGQIILLLFFVILICAIAILYNLKLTRPILAGLKNMIENTRQVARGNYDLKISGGVYSEMSALAAQFNLMVTSIRQREMQLRESEEQIRKILEASPDAITVTDLNGNIINCNQAAAIMYGFLSKDEIIGVNAFQLIVYEYLEKAKDILVKTLNEGSTYNVEYTFLKKNGEKFHGEVSCSVIMNVDNEPVTFVSVTKDITSRKKIENENQKIIRNLELKQAELERFTYTVSHDLRSPLITIKGFLGFLEEDLETRNVNQLKDDIQKISNAVDKMNNLLNDLLELSRIGRLSNEMETISLDLIIQEALELLAGHLTQRGITLKIATGLPEIYGNYKRLVELYQNLLENAIKYMGAQENPVIEIGYTQTKFETIFFVKDNGIGIDPRYHEKIFGLFDQLDQQAEGTGIGLALVKRIVETHGGKIWVESEGMNKGTLFHFTLG